MKWWAALERRDRLLLGACLSMASAMIVLLAIFGPQEEDRNPTPSSYSTGIHGANAAYQLLQHLGYQVERSTRPLDQVSADAHTTLVIAEPYMIQVEAAQQAVRRVLDHGGHVLVTGPVGGFLLPGEEVQANSASFEPDCRATANGLEPLAGSGEVHITPAAAWKQTNPQQKTAYLCDNRAVVVTFPFGKGQAVWWANSLPLENAGIQRGDNIALFLNSVGPPGSRILWDESLHGEASSAWSFAQGTPLHLIGWQLAAIALLFFLSYGRRRGPLRPDPIVPRTSSLEFVRSLGALYHKAGSGNIAVSIAYLQFRASMEKHLGIRQSLNVAQAAFEFRRKFGAAENLELNLSQAEDAMHGDPLAEKKALALVRMLGDYEKRLGKQFTQEPSLGRNIGSL